MPHDRWPNCPALGRDSDGCISPLSASRIMSRPAPSCSGTPPTADTRGMSLLSHIDCAALADCRIMDDDALGRWCRSRSIRSTTDSRCSGTPKHLHGRRISPLGWSRHVDGVRESHEIPLSD